MLLHVLDHFKLFSWEPALWLVHSQVRVVMSKNKHCHFHPQIATFEHRHENKSCSAYPKDQHKHLTCDMWHATCDMWHNYKYSLLSLHMKTKVVQHVPRINISIWHVTCDMRNVTCDIITNTQFWAYTWKQKLFSMSQGST